MSNPRAAEEIVVYAYDGSEPRDFLALVERFNRRRAGVLDELLRSIDDGRWTADTAQRTLAKYVLLAEAASMTAAARASGTPARSRR